MPAQKLTRGRFAQIIIMLSLLIVAFTWRTVTHKTHETVLCQMQPNCTFDVNGSSFQISSETDCFFQFTTSKKGWTINGDKSSFHVLQSSELHWQLIDMMTAEDNIISLYNKEEKWEVTVKVERPKSQQAPLDSQ